MKNLDGDVLHILQTLGDTPRRAKAEARHAERVQQQLETAMELLQDEVTRVIPKDHPLFETVLLLAVLRKLERKQQQEEAIPHHLTNLEF